MFRLRSAGGVWVGWTVMRLAFAQRRSASNRTGAATDVPACTASGYTSVLGGRKSASEDMMPLTSRSQVPLLAIVRLRSANEPVQTLPKSPPLAITVLPLGAPTVAG